jgi:hypothetical protein
MDQIDATIHGLPARDISLIAGDFNATLPRPTARNAFPVGIENGNTASFTDMLERHDYIPVNSMLQKKASRLITFDGPNSRHTRLDYICVTRRWRRTITNCDTIKTKVIESDHRLLHFTVTVGNEYPPTTPSRKKPSPYWPSIQNKELQEKFIRAVDAKLGTETPTFTSLTAAVMQAADENLPRLQRMTKKSPLWKEDGDIAAKREHMKQLTVQQTAGNMAAVHASHDLNLIYVQKLEERITEELRTLEKLHTDGKSTAIWRAIDRITERKARERIRIEGDSDAQKADILRSHFQSLLNNPSAVPPIRCPLNFPTTQANFDTGLITLDELRGAVKGMSSYNAPGPDGLPTAIYKTAIQRKLLPIMNAALTGQEKPPEEWLTANIIAIPKKGDLTKAANYRGISLMSTAAKLYNRILLRRLQPLDKLLLPIQSGFRQGHSTTEQILALRMMVDRCRTRQKPGVIVFIDFLKAFDSVNRVALREILSLYGVPDILLNAIMAMYADTSARVRLNQEISSHDFATSTGVLQGDTLAPFLFVLVVDYVLRDTFPDNSLAFTLNGTAKIGALAYADDIALLSDIPEKAQQSLTNLADSGGKVGLRINVRKTEYMLFPDDAQHIPLTVYGEPIKKVKDFTYLGIEIGDSQRAFGVRRAKAWAAATKLSKIFHSPVNDALKIRLFRATVESVLLYGCEALTITKTLAKVIDAAHSALLRYALGIHWPQKMTNDALYLRAGCPIASKAIRRRRLILYGHLMRQGNHCTAGCILLNPPTEKYRPGGHRRDTYERMIAGDLELLGGNTNSVVDKKSWIAMCNRAVQ